MFFQVAGGTTPSPDPGTNYNKALEVEKLDAKSLKDAQDALSNFSAEILKTFGQGRERVFELQKALVDAVPAVTRLGGNLSNVQQIISGIATASRRNVLATTEQIEKFYAVEKVLGKTANELSDSFLNVGVGRVNTICSKYRR